MMVRGGRQSGWLRESNAMKDVMMMRPNLFQRLVVHLLAAGGAAVKSSGLCQYDARRFLGWPGRAHATG